jgi:hypothetical protein
VGLVYWHLFGILNADLGLLFSPGLFLEDGLYQGLDQKVLLLALEVLLLGLLGEVVPVDDVVN